MTSQFHIFQCINPECKLRFPARDNDRLPVVCPKCKSKLIELHKNLNKSIQKEQTINLDGSEFILVLDNVRSAYNVGSILRSSDGFNFHSVYLCGITPTPENPKVLKTSLHAEINVPWFYRTNSLDLLIELKNNGYMILGMETSSKSTSILDIKKDDLTRKIALVLGNELSGLDPDVEGVCDYLLNIPMLGQKSSFNVTIAFGISAFYFRYLQNGK